MHTTDIAAYLSAARRDLWQALRQLPEEELERPLLSGERFHSIKDLVFHIAAVTDGWLHEDILRVPPVLEQYPTLLATDGGPVYAAFPLELLLDYWGAVEARKDAFVATLTPAEEARIVTVHDAPDEHYSVDGLLWHTMIHEMRHTAQICVLLRNAGVKPPSLDLLFYLPAA